MRSIIVVLLCCCASTVRADDTLAAKLKALDNSIFKATDPAEQARHAVDQKLRAANQASSAAWEKITSREAWEAFRAEKLAKLRASLHLPAPRPPVKVHVAGKLIGDGYEIHKLIYETRPQWFITANLYLPTSRPTSMPGIMLSHSHHSPKSQGELQDMGATWSRAGCAVLVPDHLGHGERRQHPFATAKDFDKEFPLSRQDYHFRYDTSLQLYLAGESLMGWMVHDLMGGVDVLLAQPGIDAKRIALLGGVAGGGDPAAVTGAVDERIACVGPFNFGGPQPETRYPLPVDAATTFHYAGSGSWESTRNLADSAADGFLPWVIVGSIAPRRLIYGHEFSWDRERDPVYARFEKVWGFYDVGDRLGFAHGSGTLRGNRPEDTHCGNIGAPHRQMVHPLLAKWFDLKVAAEDEFSRKRDASELACWTPELRGRLEPKLLHELLQQRARESNDRSPTTRAGLQRAWRAKLRLADAPRPFAAAKRLDTSKLAWAGAEAWQFDTEDSAQVQLLLLTPTKPAAKLPLVIAVAQAGQRGFLQQRNKELSALLAGGAAVALVDLRHTGIQTEDNSRGQNSEVTAHSASYLMLGQPLLGTQVDDLRSVLHYIRGRKDLDTARIALWGESFAEPLAVDATFRHPRRVDRPAESDPFGAHAAILTSLLEEDLAGVIARGGLVNYADVLSSPFVQMPHGVVVPGAIAIGDLPAVIASLPLQRTLVVQQVDGRHRSLDQEPSPAPAEWLLQRLATK